MCLYHFVVRLCCKAGKTGLFFLKKIPSAVTAKDTDLNQHVMNAYANLEEGGAIHLKNCRLRVKTETACTIVCAFVYPSAYVSTNVSCGWHEKMTGVYVGMDLSTGRIVTGKKVFVSFRWLFTTRQEARLYSYI